MTVLGYDISNNNGSVNNHLAAAVGHARFCYAKVSESNHFEDRYWTHGRPDSIRSAGMRVGGYHFIHCTSSPREEADFFLHCLHRGGGVRRGDLPPAIDFEYEQNPLGKEQNRTYLREFAEIVTKDIHYKGLVLYSGGYYLQEHLDVIPHICRAVWGAGYPNFFYPADLMRRSKAVLRFHQFTATGRLPGVAGDCDLNVFYGTPFQLARFCGEPLHRAVRRRK